MRRIEFLRRDERGTAAIEMAFAMPVLLMFVYGIFQLGVIMQANAGMQHALGQGARLATVCTPNATGCTAQADSAIVTRMQNNELGINIGTFGTPTVTTPAAAQCTNCRDLSITYTITPNFLFFNAPAVTLTRTKRVYLAH
jgi:Flp pilus assembly protein TadG